MPEAPDLAASEFAEARLGNSVSFGSSLETGGTVGAPERGAISVFSTAVGTELSSTCWLLVGASGWEDGGVVCTT